jgi:serine/threonine protein kinase
MNLLMGMMTVIPKKRYSMETVCNHPWINLGYQTLPVDYLESEYKDKMPSITKEWVNNLQSVSVCQAGCLLMEVLQERIPSKRLEQDIATTDEQGNEILTDEDDINEEEEEEVIDTGSTIKEKPKKWWKKLWTQISTAFIRENPRQRNPTERPNMVQNMRVSINELIPERVVAPYEQKVLEQQIIRNRTQTGELELKSCRSDEAVLNLKMGESSAKKSPVKHKRTNWIPQIMRSRRHN